ncbi:MAG: hypothetical protein LBU73_05640 [Helicobacteraceae bacterium]|jgi:hypothetical protein|nr:hypothetical protein [Helicobacteraceae bacterium]
MKNFAVFILLCAALIAGNADRNADFDGKNVFLKLGANDYLAYKYPNYWRDNCHIDDPARAIFHESRFFCGTSVNSRDLAFMGGAFWERKAGGNFTDFIEYYAESNRIYLEYNDEEFADWALSRSDAKVAVYRYENTNNGNFCYVAYIDILGFDRLLAFYIKLSPANRENARYINDFKAMLENMRRVQRPLTTSNLR